MSPKKIIRRIVKLHVSECSTEDSSSDTSSSLKKVTDKIRQKRRRREERVKNMIRIHKKRKRSTRKTEYERSEDSSTCNDKNVEMRPTATQQLSDPETDDEDGNSNFSPNADGMQIIDTEIGEWISFLFLASTAHFIHSGNIFIEPVTVFLRDYFLVGDLGNNFCNTLDAFIMPNGPVIDQWEHPRKMDQHFLINPGQPIRMALTNFPNSLIRTL